MPVPGQIYDSFLPIVCNWCIWAFFLPADKELFVLNFWWSYIFLLFYFSTEKKPTVIRKIMPRVFKICVNHLYYILTSSRNTRSFNYYSHICKGTKLLRLFYFVSLFYCLLKYNCVLMLMLTTSRCLYL